MARGQSRSARSGFGPAAVLLSGAALLAVLIMTAYLRAPRPSVGLHGQVAATGVGADPDAVKVATQHRPPQHICKQVKEACDMPACARLLALSCSRYTLLQGTFPAWTKQLMS